MSNAAMVQISGTELLTALVIGAATMTAATEGRTGRAAVTASATSEGIGGAAGSTMTAALNPGRVADLAVAGVIDTAATLAFTEVNDGTGQPASYDVRFAVAPVSWGGSPSVKRGTCATPLAGSAIGAVRKCTVLGLKPGTTYEFQVRAFRGTLNRNAVFGRLSNIARATTAPSATAGVGPQPGPTATIIFQDGFESGNLSQWVQDPNNGRYSVTTNAARAKSGTRSMQVLYTPTNGYGMITRWFMPGYDEVYVKFYVLFEEGFQNMRNDGNGMHFFAITGNRIDNGRSSFGTAGRVPTGSDFFYAGLDPEYIQRDPTLRPFGTYTYYPNMRCCYGNIFTQLSPKTPLVAGQWQEIVFHIKMNTPGQSNGSQTVWINGVKKLEVQNMRWRTTTDLRINQIRFDNYMPGGRKTQHIWLDDITVWRP